MCCKELLLSVGRLRFVGRVSSVELEYSAIEVAVSSCCPEQARLMLESHCHATISRHNALEMAELTGPAFMTSSMTDADCCDETQDQLRKDLVSATAASSLIGCLIMGKI